MIRRAERKRALVLFPDAWDEQAMTSPALTRDYHFERAGFDLFRSPENVRLLSFDAERFLDRLERRCRRQGVDLVLSNHELWGTLLAAELAQRLGLPGHPPEAVLKAQHKFACRQILERHLPEANPRFAAFSYPLRDERQVELPFPLLVKPVKATFSILARRVESFEALRQHLDLGFFEQLLLRRLVRPFNRLCRARLELPVTAYDFLVEEFVDGRLFNVDGFVAQGRVRVLGLIDSVLYPGTLAFERFEYPSTLPPAVVRQASELAGKAVEALGLSHGFFNVEMLYQEPGPGEASGRQGEASGRQGEAAGRLTVVEVNPRLAYQLADLYSRVEGWDLHAAELALAAGETPQLEGPQLERREPSAGAAASFVFRRFDGRPVERWPTQENLAELARAHPDVLLRLYDRRGAALRREMRWLGSYRYAVLNLGGRDPEHLFQRHRQLSAALGLYNGAGENRA